jgi:hypothetical protein
MFNFDKFDNPSAAFMPIAESNAYSIEQFRYPLNLTDEDSEFNGNKVLFFINVAVASRYSGASGTAPEYQLWDIPAGDVKSNSGQAVANAVTPEGVTASAMKRLSAAIALYMPNQLAQATSVNWSEEDFTDNTSTKYLEATAKVAESAKALLKGDTAGAASSAGGAGTAVVSGTIAQTLSGNTKAQNAARITPGNSKAELMFKGVDFRSFDFSYSFSPKSEAEAKNVLNIIRMFKHHMLPEFKDEAKFLFIYPSEFNVKYYKGSDENQYIEKQMTAILTGINVDYTPNGQFNTFANGMPTQINLTLRFRELSMPTKETSPYNKHGV